uniref:Uncharacterized protein n=1 Tax=Lepeophtheirus salmonis TaxID=72036 RepID=A0A0K2V7J3_LEPSM
MRHIGAIGHHNAKNHYMHWMSGRVGSLDLSSLFSQEAIISPVQISVHCEDLLVHG